MDVFFQVHLYLGLVCYIIGLAMAITTKVLINTKYKNTLVNWLLRILYVAVPLGVTVVIHAVIRACLMEGK